MSQDFFITKHLHFASDFDLIS